MCVYIIGIQISMYTNKLFFRMYLVINIYIYIYIINIIYIHYSEQIT